MVKRIGLLPLLSSLIRPAAATPGEFQTGFLFDSVLIVTAGSNAPVVFSNLGGGQGESFWIARDMTMSLQRP